MSNRSRRDLLRAVGPPALVGLAGCHGRLNPISEGGPASKKRDEKGVLDAVPTEAEATARVDLETALADEGVRRATNARLAHRAENPAYDGPETLSGLLDSYREALGLEFRDVKLYVPFLQWGSDRIVSPDYEGYVLTADWNQVELGDMLASTGVEYEQEVVAERPVFAPAGDAIWAGVLAEGTFVAGTEAAVRGAVETWAGDRDRLDEQLRKGFENTAEDPARFVGRMPTQHLPSRVGEGDMSVSFDVFENVKYAAGTVYRDGEDRGVTMRFVCNSEKTAGELRDIIRLYATIRKLSEDEPAIRRMLDDVEADREGSKTVLNYVAGVDQWEALAGSDLR